MKDSLNEKIDDLIMLYGIIAVGAIMTVFLFAVFYEIIVSVIFR